MTDAASPARVVQGGRSKAYRPIPAAERRAAFEAGVAAYEAGDFFAAHEHLEPAWMGASDPGERDLHQGLIKLAAAYVHGVRGNPLGMTKNLRGARTRLAAAREVGADSGGLDLGALLSDLEARLEQLAGEPARITLDPPPLRRTNR